jgi:TetR/AcrR family transcriptional regulator
LPQVRLDRGASVGSGKKALPRSVGCVEPPDVQYRKLKPGPGLGAAEVASHQQARLHRGMLKLIAELGYEAITVRELARVAGISSRSFYAHYSGKEQCFLHVHRLIVHRVLRAFEASRPGGSRGERARVAVDTLMREMDADPDAAQLLCLDAYVAGPVARGQAHIASRSIGMAIGRCLGIERREAASRHLAEGIAEGLFSILRGRLLDGRPLPGTGLCSELARWTLECSAPGEFNLPWEASTWDDQTVDSSLTGTTAKVGKRSILAPAWSGDVKALLGVASRFAATEKYEDLSVRRLIVAAGVSRRIFDANFTNLEECFLAALELKAAEVIDRMQEASESGLTPEKSICRAVAVLCGQVASDPSFAGLCFDDSVAPGLPKMRYRQQFIDDFTRLVSAHLAIRQSADQLRVQASVGSVCSVIQSHVNMGKAQGMRDKAPLLAYFLLTPGFGASTPAQLHLDQA